MEIIEKIPSLLSLLSIGCVWYFRSYLREKGKHTASKEDIKHITELVEGVKRDNASEIEHLKASLQNESQVIERRRQIYEEICNSMRVFIGGNIAKQEEKDRFLIAYSSAWLWASDGAICS